MSLPPRTDTLTLSYGTFPPATGVTRSLTPQGGRPSRRCWRASSVSHLRRAFLSRTRPRRRPLSHAGPRGCQYGRRREESERSVGRRIRFFASFAFLAADRVEVRQSDEEEDAVVGETHFSRPGDAAADEAGVGDGVVGQRKGRRARRAWPGGGGRRSSRACWPRALRRRRGEAGWRGGGGRAWSCPKPEAPPAACSQQFVTCGWK
jgi:hypothetical protein